MAAAFTLCGAGANVVMGWSVGQGGSWRTLFHSTALAGIVALALNALFLRPSPQAAGLPAPSADSDDSDEAGPHPFDDLSTGEVLRRAVRTPRFWAITLTICLLTIVCEFQSFLTLFLTEEMGLSAGDAATKAAVWQLSIAASNFAFGQVFGRLSQRGRTGLIVGLMGLMCVALTGLLHARTLPQGVMLALLALAGACMAPVYWQMPGLFSFDWAGPQHCATVGSVIDATGYLFAMVFDATAGSLVAAYGWPSFIAVLLLAGILAIASSAVYTYLTYLRPAPKYTAC